MSTETKLRDSIYVIDKHLTAGELLPVTGCRTAPPHPGEIFRAFRMGLRPMIAQAEVARRLDWRTNRMNEFEKGRTSVTVESALVLGELTRTNPETWLRLQMRFDLWQALRKDGARTRIEPLVSQ